MTTRALTVLMVIAMALQMNAQTLRGRVVDTEGSPLPYASIYIASLKSGTATNARGEYAIRLAPGSYQLVFQYLGYQTVERDVIVGREDQQLDVVLKVQPVELGPVTVTSDREDPAYTIMRKAIAKAKYHTQQVDSFSSKVYMKGSGRLKGLPGLFRKRLEKELAKEGIDTATSFTTESISIIGYKRPNIYTEKVISVRTVGNDNNTSPSGFLQGSFYEPEVNGSVSPLSPRAFAYYKFEYLGDYTDRGHLINKIRVTPRSRGDNVFEGEIYIVDQLWSIHSLDFDTYIWGILFEINQLYQPVAENVWLPVNNIFDVSGSFFGFKFEYRYFANASEYHVELNPDLKWEVEIIDDKLEKEAARAADSEFRDRPEGESAIEKLAQGEELSRKELRKVLRDYEKQERQEFEQDTLQDVVEISSYEVDSLAYSRDSTYWARIRPVPLTEYEVRGYQVRDSMAQVEIAEEDNAADSVSVTLGSSGGNEIRTRNRSEFKIQDILLGGSYSIGTARLTHESPLMHTHFNTVDGFHTGLKFRLRDQMTPSVSWEISPEFRYAFSRRAFNWNVSNQFTGGPGFEKWAIVIDGGNQVFQLNRDEPIHPWVNDIWSLLFEQNFMKVYERDYLYLGFQKDFGIKFKLEVEADVSRNRHLANTTDFKIFNNKNRSYTSNSPYNTEIGDTEFPEYKASTLSVALTFRPWRRFRIRNGRKTILDDSTPTFRLGLKYGIPDVFGSDIDYSQVELSVSHVFEFPAGGVLNLNVIGGMFLHNDRMFFPDFKHFAGSQIPFTTLDPVSSFRSLDYYNLSTRERYVSAHAFYQFRKLLATQLLEVRLTGAKEGLFLNYLGTPSSQHYFEVGYGLNYILRLFRIEVVSSFQDLKYLGTGVRFGIAANLETLFD